MKLRIVCSLQNEVVGFVEHLLRTGDSNKGPLSTHYHHQCLSYTAVKSVTMMKRRRVDPGGIPKNPWSGEGFRANGAVFKIVDFVGFQCNLSKFSLRPVAVLLDCSELELGRNLGERKVGVDHHHHHHQDHQTKVKAHDQDCYVY